MWTHVTRSEATSINHCRLFTTQHFSSGNYVNYYKKVKTNDFPIPPFVWIWMRFKNIKINTELLLVNTIGWRKPKYPQKTIDLPQVFSFYICFLFFSFALFCCGFVFCLCLVCPMLSVFGLSNLDSPLRFSLTYILIRKGIS
jgi:hypothetical protein